MGQGAGSRGGRMRAHMRALVVQGRGYELLGELGCTPVKEVWSAGGGAANNAWRQIRERVLGVPVGVSPQVEAAYGAALLARQAVQTTSL